MRLPHRENQGVLQVRSSEGRPRLAGRPHRLRLSLVVAGIPGIGAFALRPLAFTLAVFWSLQVLVCLAPAAGVDAAGEPASAHEADAHAHHHAGAGQASTDGDRAPHSHAPGSDHHQDSDGGCAQHCASLSQTVVASPASVPAPTLSLVAIAPLAVSSDLPRVLVGALARLELERPPPDSLARNVALRI